MKIVILCIGNRDGGDDGVAPYISDLLKKNILTDIDVIDAGIVPENYTGVIKKKKPDILYLIDAVEMNLSPGEIRYVPKNRIGVMHVSTHGIPLSVIINYLSEYINQIKLIGIQPKTMQGELTEPVKKSAGFLIDIILNNQFSKILDLED